MQSIFCLSTLSQYTLTQVMVTIRMQVEQLQRCKGWLFLSSSCSRLTNSHCFISLLTKLLSCVGKLPLRNGHWEAKHDSLSCAVAPVAEDAHTHPVVRWGAPKPALHVVRSRLGSRHC